MRLTGAILDRRYRIDEKLAAGGFGAIYRAMDLVMQREVALKILHHELAGDRSVVERFRREANALAQLRDPHTITMYDVGESADGTRYIVMELLRGESLHDLFHRSGAQLPWRRVVTIARGVCSSLREAHAVGIVHRDLKPANIHLERGTLGNDFVKLLDFGIAKMVDTVDPDREVTLAGQMVGTFDYMAPEQLMGGACTGKSDVFTLGVVLYEMISGERPYGDAKGPASMLMALLGTTSVPLGERAMVPPALDHLVMRAIDREPELRPDIFELDEELARILDATFDDARFAVDDEPTWIQPAKPVRITPLRVSSSPRAASLTDAPANVARPYAPLSATRPSTLTPSRGVPILPRPPAPPTRPSEFAVGSRTQIPPVPPTPPVLSAPSIRPIATPVVAPPVVRFVAPRVPTGAPSITPSIAPPTRMPAGTSSPVAGPVTEPARDMTWTRAARGAFLRGVLYALLVVAVAAAIYYAARTKTGLRGSVGLGADARRGATAAATIGAGTGTDNVIAAVRSEVEGFGLGRTPTYTPDGQRLVSEWRLELDQRVETKRVVLGVRGGITWLTPLAGAPADTLLGYGAQLDAAYKVHAGVELGAYHASTYQPRAPGDPWGSPRHWTSEAGVLARLRR